MNKSIFKKLAIVSACSLTLMACGSSGGGGDPVTEQHKGPNGGSKAKVQLHTQDPVVTAEISEADIESLLTAIKDNYFNPILNSFSISDLVLDDYSSPATWQCEQSGTIKSQDDAEGVSSIKSAECLNDVGKFSVDATFEYSVNNFKGTYKSLFTGDSDENSLSGDITHGNAAAPTHEFTYDYSLKNGAKVQGEAKVDIKVGKKEVVVTKNKLGALKLHDIGSFPNGTGNLGGSITLPGNTLGGIVMPETKFVSSYVIQKWDIGSGSYLTIKDKGVVRFSTAAPITFTDNLFSAGEIKLEAKNASLTYTITSTEIQVTGAIGNETISTKHLNPIISKFSSVYANYLPRNIYK